MINDYILLSICDSIATMKIKGLATFKTEFGKKKI